MPSYDVLLASLTGFMFTKIAQNVCHKVWMGWQIWACFIYTRYIKAPYFMAVYYRSLTTALDKRDILIHFCFLIPPQKHKKHLLEPTQ